MNNFSYAKAVNKAEFPYIRVPRELIFGEKYANISASAKFLYMAMLERMSLSQKNGWIDSEGNIFIYLTCRDAMEILACSEGKALKLFAEMEDGGLIKRKRQGLCKPDIIYPSYDFGICTGNATVSDSRKACDTALKTEEPEPHNDKDLNCKNKSSGTLEIKEPEPQELKTNNINNNKNKINKNNLNYPNPSINPYEWIEERKEYKEIIKSNIEYDYLIGERNKDIIDEIVNTMVNAVCTHKEFIRISGEDIPQIEVKRKILVMKQFHVEYIYDSFIKNKSDIKNISAYLLTSVYRASDAISLHYTSMVNHDFAERKRAF